jgi:hypothetical protein
MVPLSMIDRRLPEILVIGVVQPGPHLRPNSISSVDQTAACTPAGLIAGGALAKAFFLQSISSRLPPAGSHRRWPRCRAQRLCQTADPRAIRRGWGDASRSGRLLRPPGRRHGYARSLAIRPAQGRGAWLLSTGAWFMTLMPGFLSDVVESRNACSWRSRLATKQIEPAGGDGMGQELDAPRLLTAPTDSRRARSPGSAHWRDRVRSFGAGDKHAFPAYAW